MKLSIPPVLIIFALVCFALVQNTQAVSPPPDGDYPGGNTAEGYRALDSLTTGRYNTGIGLYSLLSLTDDQYNTGVGAGTLLLTNSAYANTAIGAGALLWNVTGTDSTAIGAFALHFNTASCNTAIGSDALVFNTTGGFNTATGCLALDHNTTGAENTATGFFALGHNTTGSDNTANGVNALQHNTTGANNTAIGSNALLNSTGNGNTVLGAGAGSGVTTANNVICIGLNVESANVDNSCFIGNISGVTVTGDPVVIDANGQLGVAPAGSPLSANELLKQQRVVQELKARTERQAAVIALQEEQIKALTAGLQKVSAQLEANKPTPQVVANDQ